MMEIVYPICNFMQRGTLRVFADWEVRGLENVPPEGPLILVANHQSNIDPAMLPPSIPRRIRFLAKNTIFGGPFIVRWFLNAYGAFPLNRDGIDVKAHRWVTGQLAHGGVVVLFPEGTRNRGGMKKAHNGVARLALSTQTPVLPVGITGTERLGTVLRVFNPTGKITLNIGPPFLLPAVEGKPDRAHLDSLTEMIMRRIAALLPSEYRGVYEIEGDGPAPSA